MRTYILFGFGIVCSIAGTAYLAAEYVRFLSELEKLFALLLVVGVFGFLGKFFEMRGW